MTVAARRTEILLAVLVPLATWLQVTGVSWVPTWLYVGPVTIGFGTVIPTLFALVVAGRMVTDWQTKSRPPTYRLALGGLAVVVVSTAVWAVATLNLAAPGLYVAGLFPMALGNLLAVGVLLRAVATRAR